MSDLNLLICFDDSIKSYALVCLWSYLKNSDLDLKPTCVTDESVSGSFLKMAEEIFPSLDIIQTSSRGVHKSLRGIEMCKSYPISAFYRLWALGEANLRGPTLYVDVDTICRNDLRMLTRIADQLKHCGEKQVAACSHFREDDSGTWDYISLPSTYHYFNSGVLLFDPEKIKTAVNPDTIASSIEVFGERILNYADQSILNYLLRGKVEYLDWTYNAISWMFLQDHEWHNPYTNPICEISGISPSNAINQSRIVHYTAPNKPWRFSTYDRSHPINHKIWHACKAEFLEGNPSFDKYGKTGH